MTLKHSIAKSLTHGKLNTFLFFVALPLLAVVATNAQAQSVSVLKSALPSSLARSERASAWDFSASSLTIETTQTLDSNTATSYAGSYLIAPTVVYKPEMITASLRLGYDREYSYQRDDGSNGDFANPTLSVAKAFVSGVDYNSRIFDSISVGLTNAVGANHDSSRRSFEASVGPFVAVSKKIGIFSISQSLGYSRGFYEYELGSDGSSNSPDVFSESTSLALDLSSSWQLSGTYRYKYSISFQAIGVGSTVALAQLSYAVTQHWGLAVGVSSAQGTLQPDGQSNELKFYEPNSAQAFFDLTVTI